MAPARRVPCSIGGSPAPTGARAASPFPSGTGSVLLPASHAGNSNPTWSPATDRPGWGLTSLLCFSLSILSHGCPWARERNDVRSAHSAPARRRGPGQSP